MKFQDLRKGDRFWSIINGIEYRKINDLEARCIEKYYSIGQIEEFDKLEKVKYNIATENE
jgi:hypothetical protein